jgi:RNA polymerase sigma factor FliA
LHNVAANVAQRRIAATAELTPRPSERADAVGSGTAVAMPPFRLGHDDPQKGDFSMHNPARDRLIADNMQMAAACAMTFAAKANLFDILPRDDVQAYAQQGLVEAANRYNRDCGVDFRTYSWNRIRGAVLDGVRKHRVEGYSRKLHLKFQALEDEQGVPEGYRVQIFFDCFRAYHNRPSGRQEAFDDAYQQPVDPEADAPDALLDRQRLRKTLLDAINALPPRERALTIRHYYSDEKLRDISAEDGVGYDVLRRVHASSLRHLRSALSSTSPSARETVQ